MEEIESMNKATRNLIYMMLCEKSYICYLVESRIDLRYSVNCLICNGASGNDNE